MGESERAVEAPGNLLLGQGRGVRSSCDKAYTHASLSCQKMRSQNRLSLRHKRPCNETLLREGRRGREVAFNGPRSTGSCRLEKRGKVLRLKRARPPPVVGFTSLLFLFLCSTRSVLQRFSPKPRPQQGIAAHAVSSARRIQLSHTTFPPPSRSASNHPTTQPTARP